jgi:tetratricopeptide (TPR) repeat protein
LALAAVLLLVLTAAAAGAGDCRSALTALSSAVTANPSSAEAHEALAICETQLGRPDRATAGFEQVTKLRPGDSQAWNNLGANLITIGQPQRAATAFRKATALDARSESAWFNYGSTLLRLGKPDDAFRALERARALAPADREIAGAWQEAVSRARSDAETAINDRRYARANELLVAIQPAMANTGVWNNLLGYASFKLNQPVAALKHLQKALALEPDNQEFLLDIGEFLIHYRANRAAREMFEAGARRIPDSVPVQFLLAVSLVLDERRADALPILRRIIDRDPSFEPAYKALGECYVEAKDTAGLIALGGAMSARNPRSATGPYLQGLGLILRATEGREPIEPAIAALRRATQLDPSLVDAHFMLARASQMAEQISDAIAALEQTVRLDPSHDRAHYSLAMLYRRTGRQDLAQKQLKIHSSLKARPRPMVLLVDARKR